MRLTRNNDAASLFICCAMPIRCLRLHAELFQRAAATMPTMKMEALFTMFYAPFSPLIIFAATMLYAIITPNAILMLFVRYAARADAAMPSLRCEARVPDADECARVWRAMFTRLVHTQDAR